MVSVIIPVLDEEARIGACLDAVLPQARRTSAEVVIVDGGSSDRTVEIADTRGARVVVSPTGRGVQMNAGARASHGSLLVFLPADTVLPAGALEVLAVVDRAGTPSAGGFRQRFDSKRCVLRVVSTLHNLRARLTGVMYGDQVPFVRRELFERVRGYDERIDMEDVDLGDRLRERVRPRLLPLTVTTSARRFDRAGDVRAVAEAVRLLLLRAAGRGWRPRSKVFFDPVR